MDFSRLLSYLLPASASVAPSNAPINNADTQTLWAALLNRLSGNNTDNNGPKYDRFGGRLDYPDKVAESIGTGRGLFGVGTSFPDNGPLGDMRSWSLFSGGVSPSNVFDPSSWQNMGRQAWY